MELIHNIYLLVNVKVVWNCNSHIHHSWIDAYLIKHGKLLHLVTERTLTCIKNMNKQDDSVFPSLKLFSASRCYFSISVSSKEWYLQTSVLLNVQDYSDVILSVTFS